MPPTLQRETPLLSTVEPMPMSQDREAAFARYCQERYARLGEIFALSSLICGLAWWPIDFLVFDRLPDYIGPFRTWRAVVSLVAFSYLILTRFSAIRRHSSLLFILSFGVVCATMGYTSGPLGGPEGAQFHFLYVLGFGTVPLPVRLSTRIALTLGFCAAVLAGCLIPFPELRAGAHVPMAVSYFLWVSGISVTFGHMLYVLLRSNFFQAALLEERVKGRTRELRDLLSRLETTREEERNRIARELHDQLGQELTAQRLTLAIAEECLDAEPTLAKKKLAEMRELQTGMIGTVRTLIGDLRPWILHDLGLGEAASWLARRTEEIAGVDCELSVTGDLASVDADRSAAVFRILQESLNNVAKHAHAKRVTIDLTRTPDALVLCVRDDGIGPVQHPRRGSFGVLGMRERANALGGDLSMHARPQGGTEVACHLPLGDDRADAPRRSVDDTK